MADHLLDITPLSQPVNPFGFLAAELRRTLHQAPASSRPQIEEYLNFLAALEAELPHITHRDPHMLVAIARLAIYEKERNQMREVIEQVEAVIAKWSS